MDVKNNDVAYHPNFIKISSGRFWDNFYMEYMYFDDESHLIDKLLLHEEIPAKFRAEEMKLPHQEDDIVVDIVRVKKKYAFRLEHLVFPRLHSQMKLLYKETYLNRCKDMANIMLAYADEAGIEADEIFSRCISTDM